MGHDLTREMRKRKLKPNLMAVWIAMGDHANDKTHAGCWANQETIARETGYSDRTVRELQHELMRIGAIVETRKPGRRSSREFRIVLAAVPLHDQRSRPEISSGLESANEIKTGSLAHQDRKSQHQDRKSQHQDRKSTPLRPEKFSGKPSEEPSENPKKENPQTRARESYVKDEDKGKDSVIDQQAIKELSTQRNKMLKSQLYKDDELFGLKSKTLEKLQAIHEERLRSRVAIDRQAGISKVIPPTKLFGGNVS